LFETRNNFSRLCQLLFVVVVAVLVFPQPASGRKRARPKDYRLILKDQRFELVMLSPHRSAIRDPALRKQYACSGMYVRDRRGPTLLYAINWFKDSQNLFVSSDGEAIASAEWHSIGFKGQTKVVICYRMGKVVQEYSEADFKHWCDWRLLKSDERGTYRFEIDDLGNRSRLSIITPAGANYVIDMHSGRVLTSHSPAAWCWILPLLAVVLVGGASGATWWIVRRRGNRSSPTKRLR